MTERIASKRRNRMVSFVINEISCVDAPAQVHARMTLMKRHSDEQQENEMQKIMTRNDDRPRAFGSLEDACAYLKANGLSASDAMSAAARQYPDLHKQYNAEGERNISKALERMRYPTEPPVVAEFNALVDEIARRDMCPRTTAMMRARAEDPELFAEFQNS